MSDKVWVGQNAMSLETAPAFEAYTGVILWYDDENAFKAGDETGRVLEIDCPWATQEMANNILASVTGYAYRPYEAAGAILDPAAELGDGVTVGGVYGQLAAINTSFDPLMASDISAPGEEEVDHEYPYESPQTREMARKVTLGRDYFGVKISKANGLEITQQDTEGNPKSRMILNSDLMAFYNDDGSEALYFDVEAGKFKFTGILNVADNFVVDAEGNVAINGNINLSGGSITWGGNNPASGKISKNQAKTIITEELVAAPTIAGGQFMDLAQENWVEMGDAELSGSGAVAYFHHYYAGYSETDPVFVMGYMTTTGSNHNWILAPFNTPALDYLENDETMYALGNWDFSQAEVTGVPAVFG